MRLVFLNLVIFAASVLADEPRPINEFQVIGTHNSYHIAPPAEIAQMISTFYQGSGEALDYTHRSLFEQFELLGIRQIELDIFADTKGGRYANPLALRMAGGMGIKVPPHDPAGALTKPGFKVLHIQDIDYGTTVYTLQNALTEVAKWSRTKPQHFPILVLLEVKDKSHSPITVKPERIEVGHLETLEKEILSVFKKGEILTPDDVRGDFATLSEAIQKRSWPTVKEAAGKVMFAMDNEDRIRDLYLQGHETLKDRLLFVSVPEKHPAAAFVKLNDPVGGFERIQRLVKAGYIVRTRADAGTHEARKNDATRRDRALESGAQFISTDYPEADERLSKYKVHFGEGVITRPNAVAR